MGSYKQRDIIYNVEGRKQNINDVPGSSYKNNRRNCFEGVYPIKETKNRKYFKGETIEDVDIQRIKFHFSYTGINDNVNNSAIGENNVTTKPVVVNMKNETEKIANTNNEIVSKSLTVNDSCLKWLKSKFVEGIAPKTFQSYEETCRNYIKFYLGDIEIKNLSADDVCSMIDKMKEKELSYRTIKNACGRLSQIIDYIYDGEYSLITKNVTKKSIVRSYLKKIREKKETEAVKKRNKEAIKGEEKGKSFTHDEVKRLITEACIKKDRLFVAYLISFAYGTRMGEVLCIKIKDVDLEMKCIEIEKNLGRVNEYNGETLEAVGTVLNQGKTKTVSSNRVLLISDEMVEILKRHINLIEKEKIKYAKRYTDEGFLFPTKFGNPTEPRNYSRSFEKVLKQANIEGHSTHNCRATFATRLSRAGVNKDAISFLLGHKVDKITADLYIDKSYKETKKELAKAESLVKELCDIALSYKIDEYAGNYRFK